MFSLKFSSTMRFVCYAGLANSAKQARFLSISNVPFTKKICSTSSLEFTKQSKTTRTKKSNDKMVEQSKLYPDEWEKLSKFDAVEHFNFFNDDSKTSSAEDKSKSYQPLDLKHELKSAKLNEEEKIFYEVSKMENDKLDYPELLSDSDSESDNSDTEKGGRCSDEVKSDKKFGSENNSFNDVIVHQLPRRSDFLSSEMREATSGKDKIVINNLDAVYNFAKVGILPKKIFCISVKSLSVIASYLSNIDVYTITSRDYQYWISRAPGTGLIALYHLEDFKRITLKEPEFPISIICDGLRHYQSFGHVMHTASSFLPKVFITTSVCANPWHWEVLRNSSYRVVHLNHDFHLNWNEIREKIDSRDRVLLVEMEHFSNADISKIRNQSYLYSIPTVDLYSHNFWDEGNITLLLLGSSFFNEGANIECTMNFCLERKALKIKMKRNLHPSAIFGMVFFELRRQWLDKNGKLGKARKNENDEKPSDFRV